MRKGAKDVKKGKQYRKYMIICICTGIAFSAAGMAALCFRRTSLGILFYCLCFAILCVAGVFEIKANKFPKAKEPEAPSPELSEEQLEALRQGKHAYNFSTPFMKRKVNIMGATFVGVGLMFAVTGLLMFWLERGFDMSEMMIGIFSGVIMLGIACVITGILLFTLKKHPQRAPYIKVIILIFCIAAGVFLFIITDSSGVVVFTDILQVIVIFYAMDVIIRQGRIY